MTTHFWIIERSDENGHWDPVASRVRRGRVDRFGSQSTPDLLDDARIRLQLAGGEPGGFRKGVPADASPCTVLETLTTGGMSLSGHRWATGRDLVAAARENDGMAELLKRTLHVLATPDGRTPLARLVLDVDAIFAFADLSGHESAQELAARRRLRLRPLEDPEGWRLILYRED